MSTKGTTDIIFDVNSLYVGGSSIVTYTLTKGITYAIRTGGTYGGQWTLIIGSQSYSGYQSITVTPTSNTALTYKNNNSNPGTGAIVIVHAE